MDEIPHETKLNDLFAGKKLFLVWLTATLALALFGLLVLQVSKYYWLSVRGVATEGRIIALQPENHNSVVYEYEVDSQDFTGKGRAIDLDREFGELRLREGIIVTYDSESPNVSCLGNPASHLKELLRPAALITLAPTLAIIVLKIKQYSKADRLH